MDDAVFQCTASQRAGACVKRQPGIFALVLLTIASMSLRAADLENGDDLHFEHCTGCHDSSVYIRSDRKMKNLEMLGRQVRFCKDTIGAPWFDDEVDDVIAFLNANYYRF